MLSCLVTCFNKTLLKQTMIMVFVFSYYRNRVRHVDEHFDLDLTYITDRIIGKIVVGLYKYLDNLTIYIV